MPREGYGLITCDKELMDEVLAVAKKEGCKTKPEVLRFLIREYKRSNNFVAQQNAPQKIALSNDQTETLSPNLIVTLKSYYQSLLTNNWAVEDAVSPLKGFVSAGLAK